jgi:group I intron endonuclease
MIIYKTTNITTGKIYVGKDLHNNPGYLGSGKKLLHAVSKYGKECFLKEVLEECSDPKVWVEREKYWIKKLNAIEAGYNIAEGGSGGNTRKGLSESEKEEYIKKMQIGRQISEKVKEAYKKKIGVPRPEHSLKLKALYNSGALIPHNLGKTTPEHVREKISKSNKGRKLTPTQKENIAKSKHKPVVVYTLDGKYLETLESIKQASEKYNIGRDSIYGCCIGKYKQGGGFVWKYKNQL